MLEKMGTHTQRQGKGMPRRSRVKTLSDKDRENGHFNLKMVRGRGMSSSCWRLLRQGRRKNWRGDFLFDNVIVDSTFSKFFEIIFIELKIHHRWGASSDPVRPQWGAGSSQDQDEEGFLKRTDSWCRMMWIKCSCQCFSKKLWVHSENINVQCSMSMFHELGFIFDNITLVNVSGARGESSD